MLNINFLVWLENVEKYRKTSKINRDIGQKNDIMFTKSLYGLDKNIPISHLSLTGT